MILKSAPKLNYQPVVSSSVVAASNQKFLTHLIIRHDDSTQRVCPLYASHVHMLINVTDYEPITSHQTMNLWRYRDASSVRLAQLYRLLLRNGYLHFLVTQYAMDYAMQKLQRMQTDHPHLSYQIFLAPQSKGNAKFHQHLYCALLVAYR